MSPLGLVLLFVGANLAHDPLIAKTTAGKLRGYKLTSRSGREFLAFAGVPYAEPPVGPLRFQPPVRARSWTGVRDATELGPWCLQYNTYELKPRPFGEEDCLYLSVYTHSMNANNVVLVHFHGGGYMSGDGPRKTQPDYFMDEDVVIVDVNFRVGFLGFFSMENQEMPGNQGLKDQVLALKWVQENIANFGGNPNQVTIVGESAGGGSVYHHTLSPMSKGLFHKAIAESGTSYTPSSLAPPGLARSVARNLTRHLNCSDSSTSAAVSCLRTKNGSEIQTGVEFFRVWQIDTKVIWPCLEPAGPHSFLPGPVSKWKHNPVPFMLGTTSGEGLLRTGYFLYYNLSFEWFNDHFNEVGPVSLKYADSASNPDDISQKLRDYYFPNGLITEDSWRNLTQMYTDSWYVAGIIDGANHHSGDVYFYYFDYIGEHTFRPGANRTLYFGAPHTEEINFLWRNPFVNWTLSGEDLKFSKRLVKIWTDFAKYGNPAPTGSDISWTKWNPERHNYLEMSNSGFKEKEDFAKDRYKFWKSINYRDNFD